MSWNPSRWWRVIDSEGHLWAETSDEAEARARMRPGDILQRLWVFVQEDKQWRDTP